METLTDSLTWTETWGRDLQLAGCEVCDWLYLLPPDRLPLRCPHCGRAQLTPLDETADRPVYTRPPELAVPFSVAPAKLESGIERFARDIWFAPLDLKPQTLLSRLQRLYLPVWLVDTRVEATWQAEVGFDYQVVSHQEKYANEQWHTREVKETRVRWEPRAGRLQRPYDNVMAPALEDQPEMDRRLGRYEHTAARLFGAADLDEALVRLPNRAADDAWREAVAALQQRAADECRQAAAADHLRDFRWSPAYHDQNWTQLLLPLYATYYLDDDDQPQTVLIHGQSGRVDGRRRASMKRAQWMTLRITAVAAVVFVLSLALALAGLSGLVSADLLTYATIGLVAGIFIGAAAVAPIAIAWQFNKANRHT